MKKAKNVITAILAAIILGLWGLNSITCDGWFNNGGCEFESTWLGGLLK